MKKGSNKFTLTWLDVLKGLVIAGGSGAAMFVQESLAKNDLVFDWQAIGMAAVGGMITYLLKNLLTDTNK